jgi:hypothetical protein
MSVWAAVDKVLGKANDQQIQAAMDYLSSIDESVAETEYAEPSKEHYKKACEAGFKGSYEDYKKEYASFPEEFPKNEAEAEPKKCDHCDGTGKHGDKDCEVCGGRGYITEAKPDFLDLDKDGNKKEPMKQAAKDAKKESTELDSIIKLAGI